MDGSSPHTAPGDPFARLVADRARVGRGSTAQRVADVLRDRIAEGALPPGTRLSEEALGAALGVSRNTLREAFRLLVHGRLVVHQVNRGVYVRVLGPDDVTDIFTVRRALEGAGLRAAPHAPPDRLGALAGAVSGGEAAARAGDWAAVGTADLRFHRALGGLAGSPRIDEYLNRVLAELRLAFLAMPSPQRLHEPFLVRNRRLVELLDRGALHHAEAELDGYFTDAQQLLLDSMRRADT
ncbi:GntR family transcriptional regulator [Streptomyces sp. Ru87]|uniref:GntR family transcriptional regulator n=1 Tax=Streptomyces sp. Ru87 TaxID=2044307 RepID=UPI000BF7DC8C|nr:GntR family transcriptional regulator [Streptomyces sp. Ru87]PGH51605.1 GntR family transcriptional regulator [Streptomyces sp. Ru87]